MIHTIFILNVSGDIIIEKHYRGTISRSICDYFLDEINKAQSAEDVIPVIQTPKYFLIQVFRDGLYFLSVVQTETPPLMILEFLHRLADIFTHYFEKISEHSIRDNFVTVYQLLDEMMDNGIPFTTEPNALMEMIPPPNIVRKVVGGITGQSQVSAVLPDGTISNTPWRSTGVKYSNNEIYFDIIEEIDSTVDPNGMPVSTEVNGEIQVLCKLSGMPELTMAFNHPGILDDVSFHPCVKYSRYEQSKVISFVPPDGQFKLMNFRVKGQLQLPIYVKPQVSFQGTSGKVSVMVGTKISGKMIEDIVITIPFNKAITSTSLSANFGLVRYDDTTKTCKWTIGKLPKDRSPLLEGTVQLEAGSSVQGSATEFNPTIHAEFKVNMYSVSGLKVDSLTLHNESYKPYKGVRSITKGGKVAFRS